MSEIASRRRRDPLLVADLHLNLAEVVDELGHVIEAGDPLDTFLLVAGAAQLLGDELDDDPGSLQRGAAVLAQSAPPAAGRVLAHASATTARVLDRTRVGSFARHRAATTAARTDELTELLATAALHDEPCDETAREALQLLRGAVSDGIGDPVASLRMPSCFRSFDLHPRDLQELAGRAVKRWVPSKVLVLGVRSSGSYLAPLLAASLREQGVLEVRSCTTRPDRLPGKGVRRLIGQCANTGWRLLVVDDPPSSGRSIARAARQAQLLGFPTDAVGVVLPLQPGGTVPGRLAAYDAVVLDWEDWDIHRRLDLDGVTARLCANERDLGVLRSIRPVELPQRGTPESHARAGYVATFSARGAADTIERSLVAEGTGLGFFGRHALAVSERLTGLVPDVYDFCDGVTLRRWEPASARVALDASDRVRQAVGYVTARREALPARRDATAAMAGRQPVWEVASRLLAAPYREFGLVLRASGVDAAVRRLLAPDRPTITDGQTGPTSWFDHDGDLVKVCSADRAFSHLDLDCYDAVYDLAGLIADLEDPALVATARATYEQRTGVRVDEERLVLYRLVHLWDRQRQGLAADVAERSMARAWQAWARARLLVAPLDRGTGGWCVLDVDGVLECSRLGHPTLTPSSAAGLRALADHGFRPLLATGRSLPELRDRCASYGLLGGVAEYGGVAYVHGTDAASSVTEELVDGRDRLALDALRAFLEGQRGVRLAGGFATMVRAYRVDARGRRHALDAPLVDAARHASRGRVCSVRGDAQTDFVPFGVDKARGVRTVLSLLGAHADEAVALGVGDGEPDLTTLRMAQVARVPAHARALAGAGVTATRRSFQRGFGEAVDAFLGHGDKPCASCDDAPHGPPGADLLTAILLGLEGGRAVGVAAAPEILRRARSIVTG